MCIGALSKIKQKLDTNFLKGCGKKSSENHSIKVMTLLKYFPSRMCELWSIFLWIQVLPRAVACLLTKHVRYQISDSAQLKKIGFAFNPDWHELRKQEKCSSLAPSRSKFYKTQWAWQGVKLTWLMSIFTSKKVWKFLIQIQLTKSNPKITRGVKVPCLMPIRVKRFLLCLFTFSKRLNGFLHIRTRRLSPLQSRLFVEGFGALKRQIFISNSISLLVIILVNSESHWIFEIESFAICGGNSVDLFAGKELANSLRSQSYPCNSKACN